MQLSGDLSTAVHGQLQVQQVPKMQQHTRLLACSKAGQLLAFEATGPQTLRQAC